MRTEITLAGALVIVVGAIVEVIGVLYANSVLQHNAYGFAGGILAVLGIIALNQGTRKPRRIGPTAREKSSSTKLRSWFPGCCSNGFYECSQACLLRNHKNKANKAQTKQQAGRGGEVTCKTSLTKST
jgi:hypothetical protein